jgi:hypothetical protein
MKEPEGKWMKYEMDDLNGIYGDNKNKNKNRDER